MNNQFKDFRSYNGVRRVVSIREISRTEMELIRDEDFLVRIYMDMAKRFGVECLRANALDVFTSDGYIPQIELRGYVLSEENFQNLANCLLSLPSENGKIDRRDAMKMIFEWKKHQPGLG